MSLQVNPPATIDANALITITGIADNTVTATSNPPLPAGVDPKVVRPRDAFTITLQGTIGTNYTSLTVISGRSEVSGIRIVQAPSGGDR
jgi:hypothetical protein